MPAEPAAAAEPLTSDEDIERMNVGPVTPHDGPIVLMEYDPRWPQLFAREAGRIREALASLTIRVEHAGSTSVPGLAAKPIIDIVLVVPDSSDEPAYVPALESAGYVLRLREPDWYEHRLLKGPDTDVNLHAFSVGAAEVDRMLLFRDWLRSHESDRSAYLAVKRELAERTWRHVQHYADAKTAIVRQILDRATAAADSGLPSSGAS
jgi:GrpB-like predicted nucleotidyltransferase (UPF0157 family)